MAGTLSVDEANPNKATAPSFWMSCLAFSPEILASFLSSSVISLILLPLTPPASLTFLKYAKAPLRISLPSSALPPVSGADWPTMMSAAVAAAEQPRATAVNAATSKPIYRDVITAS